MAGLGAEAVPVTSLRENGSEAERGVFVHAVCSAVSARRESLHLMTGGSGLFKTKKKKKSSFAAQTFNRHRPVKIFVLFTVGGR